MKEGVLEIAPEGWGFLRRTPVDPICLDIYVSRTQIERFGLKAGDTIVGEARPPRDGEKYNGLLRVESVNGRPPMR